MHSKRIALFLGLATFSFFALTAKSLSQQTVTAPQAATTLAAPASAAPSVTSAPRTTLTGNDLEGLDIADRTLRISAVHHPVVRSRKRSQTHKPVSQAVKVVADVLVTNYTRFHVTRLSLNLNLYFQDVGGATHSQLQESLVPYVVKVNLTPGGQGRVVSDPMTLRFKPRTRLSSYYMTLVEAVGTPVAVDPALSPVQQLAWAAQNGDLQTLQSLGAAHPELVRAGSDGAGSTLLDDAVAAGHLAVATFLLDHGASINQKGEGDQTPLDYAVYWSRVSLVNLLLARGADAKSPSALGTTPLQKALQMVTQDGDQPDQVAIVHMLQAIISGPSQP